MAVLSRLAVSSSSLSRALLAKPGITQLLLVRNAGGHAFKKRPGQLMVNRVKDVLHFYVIGLGLIPMGIILIVTHLLYGSACELTEYPTDGTIPHYWQYERTPLRQLWVRFCAPSDIERHERMLSWNERNSVFARWRKYEERVKHLQGERWDYKGWYYEPVSTAWVDYSRYIAERYRNEYEAHGHYKI